MDGRWMRPALAVLAILALAACGPTEEDEGATEGTPPAEGTAIEVVLTEFQIDMPTSIPAGAITFDVANSGEMTHNFEVEGNGVEETLEEDLAPNQTASLSVELEPGTYTVYCPIGDHADQGMEIELEVTES
jgi:uncharacterized cupredoxin-like copper-binding protein